MYTPLAWGDIQSLPTVDAGDSLLRLPCILCGGTVERSGNKLRNAANRLHGTHEDERWPWTDIYVSLSATCTWISSISTCMYTTWATLAIGSTWSILTGSGYRWRASVCCALQPPPSSKQTRAFDLALVSTTVLGLAFPNLTPVLLPGRWEGPSPWRHTGQDLPWGFGPMTALKNHRGSPPDISSSVGSKRIIRENACQS